MEIVQRNTEDTSQDSDADSVSTRHKKSTFEVNHQKASVSGDCSATPAAVVKNPTVVQKGKKKPAEPLFIPHNGFILYCREFKDSYGSNYATAAQVKKASQIAYNKLSKAEKQEYNKRAVEIQKKSKGLVSMRAFGLFRSDRCKVHKGMAKSEQNKLISLEWKTLTSGQKKYYMDRAQQKQVKVGKPVIVDLISTAKEVVDSAAPVLEESLVEAPQMWIIKPNWINHGDNYPINSADIDTSGTQLLTVSSFDSVIMLWDMADIFCDAVNREPITIKSPDSAFNCVRWHPSKNWFASGGDDKLIKVWRLHETRWQESMTLLWHSVDIRELDWSPAGNLLASGGMDGAVALWDIESGHLNPSTTLYDLKGSVAGLKFNPNGTILACQSAEGLIVLWSWDSWEVISILRPLYLWQQPQAFSRISWSPDGNLLGVSGGSQSTFQHVASLVDVERRQIYKNMWGHLQAVTVVKFSPTHNLVAIGSNEGTLSLFDVDQDRCVLAVKDLFASGVSDISWQAEGYGIIAVSSDGTVTAIKFEVESLGEISYRKLELPKRNPQIGYDSSKTNQEQPQTTAQARPEVIRNYAPSPAKDIIRTKRIITPDPPIARDTSNEEQICIKTSCGNGITKIEMEVDGELAWRRSVPGNASLTTGTGCFASVYADERLYVFSRQGRRLCSDVMFPGITQMKSDGSYLFLLVEDQGNLNLHTYSVSSSGLTKDRIFILPFTTAILKVNYTPSKSLILSYESTTLCYDFSLDSWCPLPDDSISSQTQEHLEISLHSLKLQGKQTAHKEKSKKYMNYLVENGKSDTLKEFINSM